MRLTEEILKLNTFRGRLLINHLSTQLLLSPDHLAALLQLSNLRLSNLSTLSLSLSMSLMAILNTRCHYICHLLSQHPATR